MTRDELTQDDRVTVWRLCVDGLVQALIDGQSIDYGYINGYVEDVAEQVRSEGKMTARRQDQFVALLHSEMEKRLPERRR